MQLIDKICMICKIMEKTGFFDIETDVLGEFEVEIDILLENSKSLSEDEILELVSYASKFDILYEDFSNMIIDVVLDSNFYPNQKFWRFEPFSDLVQELKASMIPNTSKQKYEVPFSFGNYNIKDVHQLNYIISQVDIFDKYDIDNFIGMIYFFNNDEIEYPSEFENRIIRSINHSGYSVEYYGKDNFHISELGSVNNLYSLQKYLESTLERNE